MKKNLLCSFLIISLCSAIITTSNNSFHSKEQPNKPKINNPLPESAYEYVYKLFENELSTADTEFIMFLQNRYKKNKDEQKLQEEDKLIAILSKNFTENKKLSAKNLPNCAFATATQTLYFHQIIADTQSYPQNYILAPFEQNYNFKLYPMSWQTFIENNNSIPATQAALYRQTVLKNFAKFLLLKFAKK